MRSLALGWMPACAPGIVPGLVVGLFFALGGCDKASDKARSKKSKKSTDPVARPIPEKVGVKLLAVGKGPRQKLRYRFGAPETHEVVVTIAMSVGVSTKERSVPVQQMPDMQMRLVLRHRAVSPAGVLRYTFELIRAGLVGGGGGAMKRRFSKVLGPSLQQLVGLKGSGEVTPSGLADQAELKLPSTIPGPARKAVQSLQDQIQQLATPLPAVAVGVGAQWEVTKPLTLSTLRMGQSAKYTLVKRQGSKVTFDVRIEQFAPRQELRSSQLPLGAKAVLNSLKSTGKGRFDIDLTRPGPRGSLRYETRMDQTISARGKSQRMELDLRVHARFEPQGSPAP